MTTRYKHHAVARFGLGARPGELRSIGSDPVAYVLKQLEQPSLALIDDPQLRSSSESLVKQQRLQAQRRRLKKGRRRRRRMDSDSGAMRAGSLMQSEGMGADRSNDEFNAVKKQMRQLRRQTFRAEATARSGTHRRPATSLLQ